MSNSLRVMIVDDDRVIRNSTSLQLKAIGDHAVAVADEHHRAFDVVVLVALPGLGVVEDGAVEGILEEGVGVTEVGEDALVGRSPALARELGARAVAGDLPVGLVLEDLPEANARGPV